MHDAQQPVPPLSVIDVENFFLSRDAARPEGPDVTPMKLQKLLFLAQGNYLGATERRLFDETVYAYDFGPVVHPVFKRYHELGDAVIVTVRRAPALPAIRPDLTRFLDDIWTRWKSWSAGDLSDLTHRQKPWKQHYRFGVKHTEIPDLALEVYFGSEAPAAERVLPNRVTHVDRSSLGAPGTGMFARPASGVVRLPSRGRNTPRGDR